MEGHRRLAGARAALDDQYAAERRADDLVLFSAWMVDTMSVIRPGPGPVQCGQEGGGAADGQVAHDELA